MDPILKTAEEVTRQAMRLSHENSAIDILVAVAILFLILSFALQLRLHIRSDRRASEQEEEDSELRRMVYAKAGLGLDQKRIKEITNGGPPPPITSCSINSLPSVCN